MQLWVDPFATYDLDSTPMSRSVIFLIYKAGFGGKLAATMQEYTQWAKKVKNSKIINVF